MVQSLVDTVRWGHEQLLGGEGGDWRRVVSVEPESTEGLAQRGKRAKHRDVVDANAVVREYRVERHRREIP